MAQPRARAATAPAAWMPARCRLAPARPAARPRRQPVRPAASSTANAAQPARGWNSATRRIADRQRQHGDRGGQARPGQRIAPTRRSNHSPLAAKQPAISAAVASSACTTARRPLRRAGWRCRASRGSRPTSRPAAAGTAAPPGTAAGAGGPRVAALPDGQRHEQQHADAGDPALIEHGQQQPGRAERRARHPGQASADRMIQRRARQQHQIERRGRRHEQRRRPDVAAGPRGDRQQHPDGAGDRGGPAQPDPGRVANHGERGGGDEQQVAEQAGQRRVFGLHQRRRDEGADDPDRGDQLAMAQRDRQPDQRGARPAARTPASGGTSS